MSNLNSTSVKRTIAFGAIYFIWGSTFLAIRFSVATIPPFFMMGFRCLAAGAILYTWARLKGKDRPHLAHWLTALVLGTLLFTVGHGSLAWSEQFLPSGIAALICATSPLWITLLQTLLIRENALSARVVLGLIMGLIGVTLLVEPSMLLNGAHLHTPGAIVLLVGTLSWSFGVIYSKKSPMPENTTLAAGMNLITGGAGLLLASIFQERVIIAAISLRSLVSLGYLIVFGSIFTFTAYYWLLRETSPSRVATHSFVNPVVAIFVGWSAGGELINPRILLAAVLMAIGVAAIVRDRSH